jgi:hypothetical protein
MRTIVILIGLCAFSCMVNAQRRSVLGMVCGDPTLRCSTRENFHPYELPFEFGKNNVISRSQFFYAVILKSIKLNDDQSNCATAIPDSDLNETQKLFPRNKVFVMRCWETGQNSYTNVADGVSFIAVYAGRTLKEANGLLHRIRTSSSFNGLAVRRMRVEINGT